MVDMLEVQCPNCRTFFRPTAATNPSAIFCPRCGRNAATAEPPDNYERSNATVGIVLGGCLAVSLLFGLVIAGLGAWLFLRVAPQPPIAMRPRVDIPPPAPPSPPTGISESDGAPPSRTLDLPPAQPPTLPEKSPRVDEGVRPRPGEPNPFDSARPVVPGTTPAPKPPGGPQPAPEKPATDPPKIDSPLIGATTAASLYGWKPQDKHFYQVVVGATVDESRRESRGSLLLTTVAADPTAALDGTPLPAPEKAAAVGSAFFVSSQGHLVTCAHVLRGATSVQVRYGGELRTAKILAQQHELDLALLRLDVTDAPALELGDSDAVQLAQEVRAVGYPLSDVLGESVKVTRGSVAGLLDQDERRMLQIDAAINAGNSGGPIVDEHARVVGVATAKLAGEDVSNVGFAVPANALKQWLVAQGVELAASANRARLDGPELAKQVTPAVVLVDVEIGPGGIGEARQFVIGFTGHISEEERAAPRNPAGPGQFVVPRPPRFPGVPRIDQGKLRVDATGTVEESQGQEQLPFLLGPLATSPFEPLPPAGTKKWTIRRTLTLLLTEQNDNPFGFPSGLRPRPGFGAPRGLPPFPGGPFDPTDPFGRRRAEADRAAVSLPALETLQLEVVAANDRELRVKKSSELKSVGKGDAPVSVSLTMTGEFVVDRALGVVVRSNYAGKFVEKKGAVERAVPITWSCTRSDPPPIPPPAPVPMNVPPGAAAIPPPAPLPGPPQLTDEVINELLTDIRRDDDKNHNKRRQALNKFGGAEPLDTRRGEVFDAAIPYVKDSNSGMRSAAIRACVRWAGKDQVLDVIRLIDEVESRDRFQVYLALGSAKLVDERLARKLVDKLHSSDERSLAFQALRAQGAVAETALLEALQRPDLDQQAEFFACILLGDFGGEKSLEVLKKAIAGKENDPQSFRRSSAARSIENRLKAAPPK